MELQLDWGHPDPSFYLSYHQIKMCFFFVFFEVFGEIWTQQQNKTAPRNNSQVDSPVDVTVLLYFFFFFFLFCRHNTNTGVTHRWALKWWCRMFFSFLRNSIRFFKLKITAGWNSTSFLDGIRFVFSLFWLWRTQLKKVRKTGETGDNQKSTSGKQFESFQYKKTKQTKVEGRCGREDKRN